MRSTTLKTPTLTVAGQGTRHQISSNHLSQIKMEKKFAHCLCIDRKSNAAKNDFLIIVKEDKESTKVGFIRYSEVENTIIKASLKKDIIDAIGKRFGRSTPFSLTLSQDQFTTNLVGETEMWSLVDAEIVKVEEVLPAAVTA